MCVFNRSLATAYIIIALLFAGGFILRVLQLYPGVKEPLALDFYGVIIALLFASLATALAASSLRFVLIPFSSLIILPHILYIISNEHL